MGGNSSKRRTPATETIQQMRPSGRTGGGTSGRTGGGTSGGTNGGTSGGTGGGTSGGKRSTTTQEEQDIHQSPVETTPAKHSMSTSALTRSPLSSIRHHPSPLRAVPATPNNTPAKGDTTAGVMTVFNRPVNDLKDSSFNIKEEEVGKGMETNTIPVNNNRTSLSDDKDDTGINGGQEGANGTQTMDTSQPVNNTIDTNNNPIVTNDIATTNHPASDNVLPTAPALLPPIDVVLLFDLETTGLPLNSDICQISVQVLGEERVWSRYLVPTRNIAPGASRVNGLKVSKDENGKRVLLRWGQEVPAKSYIDGLKEFYMYLCQLSRKHKKLHPSARLILLAHNGRRFDAPILINALRKISVTAKKLNDISVCFSDSWLILRELQRNNNPLLTYSDCVDGGMKVQMTSNVSLKLTSLYQHLFNEGFPAHDATEDVKAMKRILFEPPLQLPISIISNNTFKPEQV